ncbi:MAG: bifunctional diguanylate cyclase/phosphodiesterase [Aquabacterium sp.]|uniref:putative bifunctional diguanylate cyclase/phosphodiesterase n=1 Tax=Aquabacterium sp. TaxID=1872578 RepID=UPI0025C55DFB|nr:bifunctional diguanylate cyclase/phosphodiesterase [Aquabacterium sp.]MBI5924681.1 bifunctional diguanylate cyclase/phosphodiesterase [Aquabacterium sp.]
MSPDHPSSLQWWWMLAALVGVGVLMSILRAWLAARQRAAHAEQGLHRAPPPVASPEKPATQVQDPLTGLATRLWLEDQLAAAVMRAEARQRRLALLYVDMDGFKPVNDSFGYASGDALLREVGHRLASMGRGTDTIARMGSDEFIMLLDGDPDSASAALVADRVRHKLQIPYVVAGREVRLSCSIGIVMYPEHGPRAKLIARADAAMLAAKHAGGNMHCFFDASMDHDSENTIDLQRDLRRAIETRTGLELHYQPKIDGRTGDITGAEALLRWHHPERGMVSPAVFIPIAERFGLIGALGQWVTDEACRQVHVWLDQGLRMHVAINLSVHQLRQSDLVDKIQEALTRHKVPAELITFEVTESAAMEDAKASMRIFERLSSIGVHLSIDDFGTGYSSLSHLRKLPATQLKIDRSFVQDVDQEEDAKAIVRAVIKLAHALGLTVVAEGVETQAQQGILRHLGCDEMQGYLFAKPMPAAHLNRWVSLDKSGDAGDRPGFRLSAFNMDEPSAGRPGPVQSE